MDSQITDPSGESKEIETPEDVAVLYSWANLHGAKYRDFSASRREYRAQMRRRAAEKQREEELRAKAEAEEAAAAAEAEAKKAEEAASQADQFEEMDEKERALFELHEAQRRAKAERIEAERRAEAAALAEADLLNAEREMADAHASAQRQAARYAESEQRRKHLAGPQPRIQVPGAISDPYTPESQQPVEVEHHIHHPAAQVPAASSGAHASRSFSRETRAAQQAEIGARRRPRSSPNTYAEHLATQERRAEFDRADAARMQEEQQLAEEEREARHARAEAEARWDAETQRTQGEAPRPRQEKDLPPARREEAQRGRPRGFHPDQTSGERPAYKPRQQEPAREDDGPTRYFIPVQSRPSGPPEPERYRSEPAARLPEPERYRAEAAPRASEPPARVPEPRVPEIRTPEPRAPELDRYRPQPAVRREQREASRPEDAKPEYRRPAGESRYMGAASSRSSIRLPDDLLERMGSVRPVGSEPLPPPPEPASLGPAWLYPEQEERERKAPLERSGLHRPGQDHGRVAERPGAAAPSPIDDTLQQSRERVAARWYALKGAFEGGAQEAQPELPPMRQTEMRTPVLAVFSLAGGVGRTSLVATLGRALSSMGEKVLLTDTSANSMLPFYFGASELRPGVVRTFSPPSGSTDAPISCVSYDVDHRGGDQAAQDWFAEELTRHSRGLQRVLLDLSGGSGWVARRLARMNPTVLVPVAPDMNSVISLQAVERFFAGVTDCDGRQVQPYFLLNQFDASLPLHLDVREVLRRQLGDRLLPFVVRRAPAVSEALAEGMTVMDYAPDAAVSSDYTNVASWLRSIAAPATAGFRNLRWSER